MSTTRITVLLAAALFWVGCDGSPVPISEAGESSIDERLVGLWDFIGEEEGGSTLLILPFNENEYYVEMKESGDDETYRMRAYTTPIDGVMFANVQCIGCDDNEYFFFKYLMPEPDVLELVSVNEDLYDDVFAAFETTTELSDYLQARIEDSDLFEEDRGRLRRSDD